MNSSEDIRTLAKWLNEEQTAPIDRNALARVLAAVQAKQEHGSPEDMYVEMHKHLNCPHCGGSGHIDDAKQEQGEPVTLDKADGHFEQPHWGHVGQAFIDGAREARANPDATEEIFILSADGYTKRLFEELDPESERLLREQAYPAPKQEQGEPCSHPCGDIKCAVICKRHSEQDTNQPVAWRTFDGEGGYDYRSFEDNENYKEDYIKRNGDKYKDWVEPLYTQPQQRKPLTDDEIWKNDNIMAANSGYGANFETLREVIRAVEAAHGIKVKA